jgi:hypothetical protein
MGNYSRPVIQFGPTANGLHRYLYGQADQGTLYLWTEMAAMEYGLPHRRFLNLLHQLTDAGSVKKLRDHGGRLQAYHVTTPRDYNPETDERRQFTDEETDDAIVLLEQIQDLALELEGEEIDDADGSQTGITASLQISGNEG